MKTTLTAIAALLIAATVATAQLGPPLIHDIEASLQQLQELDDIGVAQGAAVEYRVRLKSRGQWLSLAGLTATWDARSNAAAQVAYTTNSVATVTNVTPNYFRIPLTSAQTGTAVTNWIYALSVSDGTQTYVLGTGRYDSEESGWTGSPAVLVGATVDWTQVGKYIGTATHGPVRADGSTITAAVNADGSITLTSIGAAPDITIGDGLEGLGTEASPYQVTEAVRSGAAAGATATQPNAISGTDSVGTEVVNGQVTEVGALTPWTGEGYITSYIRSIVAAGDRMTVTASTNGTEVTYTITATDQSPDLTNYLQIGDSNTNLVNDAGFISEYIRSIVAAGDRMTVTASTNDNVVTYTVAAESGGIADAPDSEPYFRQQGAWVSATTTVAQAAGALQRSGGAEQEMTGDLHMGANTVDGQRFGEFAGWGASGNDIGSYGFGSGYGATGTGWHAGGNSAGTFASGDWWSAFGYFAGLSAVTTNTWFGGQYAGFAARGNNRMYLDVYSDEPVSYGPDGATNDTIVLDSDGRLYLGGGAARAENPSAGVTLRGPVSVGGVERTTWPEGTTDHAAMSNLAWTASDHTGGTNRLAGFGASGEAVEIEYGTMIAEDAASYYTIAETDAAISTNRAAIPTADSITTSTLALDLSDGLIRHVTVATNVTSITIAGATANTIAGQTVIIQGADSYSVGGWPAGLVWGSGDADNVTNAWHRFWLESTGTNLVIWAAGEGSESL